jgi:nitronate monooxygenase
MGLRSALTDMFGIEHPIVLAPMGAVAGGRLAAAVAEGGGLGMIGGGRGNADWLQRECSLAASGTERPWGIGLLSWAIDRDTLAAAIAWRPAAIMLSFGDPAPFAPAIHDAAIPRRQLHADEAALLGPLAHVVEILQVRRRARELRQENRRTFDRLHVQTERFLR